MTESDDFLSRWSRRKQQAKREPEVSSDPPDAERAAEAQAEVPGSDARADGEQESTFDLSTLPSIESIGSGTDIRSFLQKGVPLELTRAALRRAWTTDPAIRDFIEVAENQWDFATGKGLPGFGQMEFSLEEIRKMVAEVFEQRLPVSEEPPDTGKTGETGPNPPLQDQQTSIPEQARPDELTHSVSSESNSTVVHHKEENVAVQKEPQQINSSLPVKRSHGGALPE